MKADVTLSKIRHLLEENAYSLAGCQHLWKLILLMHKEQDKIKVKDSVTFQYYLMARPMLLRLEESTMSCSLDAIGKSLKVKI